MAGEKDKARREEARAIARRLHSLVDPTSTECPVVDKDSKKPRRLEPGDVAILFRTLSDVQVYEESLREFGLDYYLVGGRAFFAQQEIYDFLNLLRAIENPHDSVSLVGALRAPFFNLSDEALLLIAIHDDGVWAGLHDPERLAAVPEGQRPAADRAARLLADWRNEKDRLPIARLINRVLADTGYDAALQFEILGDRKLANLWKLIDLARAFDRTGRFGLHEFTARLDDLVSQQPREEQAATLPESADVIKLMSIHQAKGLEFPVVFVPDFAAQRQGDRSGVARWHRTLGCLVKVPSEFDNQPPEERPFAPFADELGRVADQVADWQEDLRILYVACTRAADRLFLSACRMLSNADIHA
jgi:ATP-dependent helicase/nuclease subunit A